jgi:hypothetical protein
MEPATIILGMAMIVGTGALTQVGKNMVDNSPEAVQSINELLSWIALKLPQSKTIVDVKTGKKIDYGKAITELRPLTKEPEGQRLFAEAQVAVSNDLEMKAQLEKAIIKIEHTQLQLRLNKILLACLFFAVFIPAVGWALSLGKKPDTLNMTVVDKDTNSPVPNVEIKLKDAGSTQLSTHSGDDGIAMIEGQSFKPPINIKALKEGYENYNENVNSDKDSMLRNIRLVKKSGGKVNPPPETPSPSPSQSPPFSWKPVEKIGEDSKGGSAKFIFHTLIGVGDGHRWKFESDSKIDSKGKEVQKANDFLKEKLKELVLAKEASLVAVGNASCEGDSEKEGVRARNRADVIFNSIQATLPNKPYRLILGKYKDDKCSGKNPESTMFQRSIIVISFTEATKDLDKTEAAKDAFRKVSQDPEFKEGLYGHFKDKEDSPLGSKLDLDIDKYTCFELANSPPPCK